MTSKLVKEIVEDYYKLKIDTKTRQRKYVEARAIYYKLLRENSRMSLEAIGKTVNRDHATAIHSLKQIKDWLEYDKEIKRDYNTINSRLQDAMRLNPELFKDVLTMESFYEIEYHRLKHDSDIKYKSLLTKYHFLKSRLEKYEPNRVERGEFDLV
jgi:predicted nuclease with TOPRIM domain